MIGYVLIAILSAGYVVIPLVFFRALAYGRIPNKGRRAVYVVAILIAIYTIFVYQSKIDFQFNRMTLKTDRILLLIIVLENVLPLGGLVLFVRRAKAMGL